MFRKIRSNRDPRDTVYSELKNEFRPYLLTSKIGMRSVADRHPRIIFWFMVVNIALSAVLTITVFGHKPEIKKTAKPVPLAGPLSTGFGELLRTADAMRQTITLRKQIDSLSAKKHLGPEDSLALEKALDQFQKINQSVNHKK